MESLFEYKKQAKVEKSIANMDVDTENDTIRPQSRAKRPEFGLAHILVSSDPEEQ
jgi:hypothetical protein